MTSPKILVVEDNPVEQKIVSVLALRLGVDVDVAGTGYKALDLLSNNSYSAVFMNYMLPAMNGLECTHEIRRLKSSASMIPIIALTAFTADGALECFLDAGMNDYLSKPYTVEQFENVLNRWVPASESRLSA